MPGTGPSSGEKLTANKHGNSEMNRTLLPRIGKRYREWLDRSIANRVIVGAVTLTMTVVAVIAAVSYHVTDSLLQNTTNVEVARRGEHNAQRITYILSTIARDMSQLAGSPLVSNALEDEGGRDGYLVPFLRNYSFANIGAFQLSVTDFKGRTIAANTANAKQAHVEPWTKMPLHESRPYATLSWDDANTLMLILAYPIKHPQTKAAEGMLVAEIPLFALLDGHGQAAWPSTIERLISSREDGSISSVGSSPILHNMGSHVQRLKLPDPLSSLALQSETYLSLAHFRPAWNYLLVGYGAGTLIVFLIVIWGVRRLSKSVTADLSELSHLADQVVGNDIGSQRIQINRNDEVGRLGKSFNTMLDRLQGAYVSLAKNIAELRIAAQVFETKTVGIMIMDAGGSILIVNKACREILDIPDTQVQGKQFDSFIKETCRDPLAARPHLANGEEGELEVKRRDGSRVISAMLNAITDATGSVCNFICFLHDITERREHEKKIRILATHDALTGLPNRILFLDRLHEALLRARRHEQGIAVIVLDLDRFASINDSMGHPAGDVLLQRVGTRLRSCIRDSDTVARLGGDEFAVLIEEILNPSDASGIAQKLLDALGKPVEINGQPLVISGSLGISCYPRNGSVPEELLKNADAAMYQAKAMRNSYRFFSEEMNRDALDILVMTNELRGALDREEFVLYYQPRVNTTSGKVTGVEALLRWQHPSRGLVLPGVFIPLLEDTGMIVHVGYWIIRAACQQARAWASAGYGDLQIAVNLSPRQFREPDLASRIIAILNEVGTEAGTLELEITEGTVMTNPAAASKMLEQLKSTGIKIAVDDFGTGYSSLSYLRRFPLDALKIDQSFVRDMVDDADGLAIVQATIALARNLRLSVIAEGVENTDQAKLLRLLQCDEMQGYLISRPLPCNELELWLKKSPSCPEIWSGR